MIYFYIRYIILRKGGQSRRKGRVSVKNRVTVTIGGMEYHLLADDDPQYVKKTAELVDRKLREVHQGSANLSALTAAVSYTHLFEFLQGAGGEPPLPVFLGSGRLYTPGQRMFASGAPRP